MISFTLLVLIFVVVVGTVAIAAYLACCLFIVMRRPRAAGAALFHYSLLFVLPALGLISTVWSDAPDVTLKQSLEWIATVVAAIIVMRRVGGRELASALLVPTFAVCLLCLAVQPSALHGAALYGVLGSKNYCAFVIQILMGASAVVLLDPSQPKRFRMFAAVGLALGVFEIVLARSAGGWITSFFAFAAFVTLRLSSRMSLTHRVVLIIGMALVIAPFAFAPREVVQVAQDFQQHVLHKNASLSGRTIFWTFSQSLIAERPLLGHGFSAFWRQGNLDAEGLWRSFGIGSRMGINFHNQFVDMQVDLGAVGNALFIVTLACIGLAALVRAVVDPTVSSAFMASVLIELYMRLPVESTLLGPWSLFNTLWVGIAISAFAPSETWAGFRARPRRREPRSRSALARA